MSKPLTFADIAIGAHFIDFPKDGDDSGHGGFRGKSWIFEKTAPGYEPGVDTCRNNARRLIDGNMSAIPNGMRVICVEGCPGSIGKESDQ